MKILICEDELLIAENLRLFCQNIGYEVLGIASNETEVKECLSKYIPDIILLDINLSGNREGIEIANYINLNLKIPATFS